MTLQGGRDVEDAVPYKREPIVKTLYQSINFDDTLAVRAACVDKQNSK